jgi:hypothetical protein
MFSGIELALSSKPQDYRDAELFLVLLMAAALSRAPEHSAHGPVHRAGERPV